MRARQQEPEALRRINPAAAIVAISPFGQSGPKADQPATDLTLFFASGIARMLTGQVDDLDEPPIRPVGEQSAFIGGLAAACAITPRIKLYASKCTHISLRTSAGLLHRNCPICIASLIDRRSTSPCQRC